MIFAAVTVRVHPEKAAAYEAVCREYLPQARASEPGTLYIEVARSREQPNTYTVIEVYEDEAAMALHIQAEYLQAVLPRMHACFDGEVQVRMHDTV